MNIKFSKVFALLIGFSFLSSVCHAHVAGEIHEVKSDPLLVKSFPFALPTADCVLLPVWGASASPGKPVLTVVQPGKPVSSEPGKLPNFYPPKLKERRRAAFRLPTSAFRLPHSDFHISNSELRIPNSDTLRLTLKEAVNYALDGAPDVKIAKTAVKNSYWRYQSFLANYRPQINLGATLPNLNRSIDVITLPDGTDAFINRALMRNSLNLSLNQDIALTGGSIFASTSLQRIDVFKTNTSDGSISYLSTPFAIGFEQPIFGFNDLKWDKRIQPLVYEEAQRAFSEDMAEVSFQTAGLFFEVLIAQLNLEAAVRDKADADTLLGISRGRFEVGRIAETELLQIELNAMNADANLASSTLNLQTSTEGLRNFLGIQNAVNFQLKTPDILPVFDIDLGLALELALKNRSESIQYERREREAEREVAQAKADSGPDVNINGYFGLSQTAMVFNEAYAEPLNQEQLRIGINIPVADWGKARARLEIAQSNRELVQLQVDQERVSFEREIQIKVQQFELQRQQVILAERAYEVAQKRLNITRQRYRIGKILVTDLNIAISEEANARRGYVNALRSFWLAYYDLQRLVLYDFDNQLPLEKEWGR